ncbi:MAG: glycerol-3-phosphate 1-O-acyltransferase PlsY [Candidatus Zixiibacteriota bacterium]|nr:MAG: glycerol-3-phosphate 1-O-acyltransferase PlsY [candidate division Zixibacteria bacterium]
MYDILAIIIGYILGSVPFALLITRAFGVKNLRAVGSGNLGATNAWRAAGPAAGILVSASDIGKGVLAVLIAGVMPDSVIGFEYIKLMSGIAAVLGHIFPVFLLFRGGKGVNTALGVMITLLPVETLIALGIFIIAVAASRRISLGSILAAIVFAIVISLEYLLEFREVHPVYVPTALFLMVLIIVTHRTNIKRLISGKEGPMNFKTRDAHEVENNA